MTGTGKIRVTTLLAATLALAGCGSLIPGGSGGAAPGSVITSDRTPAARPATRVSSAPQSYAPRPEDASCLADLGASGARFDALPDAYA
ncbi:MAG: extensin, partial [Erythrobacter sp.]|nr:extensin [Erythrobacter sp.]